MTECNIVGSNIIFVSINFFILIFSKLDFSFYFLLTSLHNSFICHFYCVSPICIILHFFINVSSSSFFVLLFNAAINCICLTIQALKIGNILPRLFFYIDFFLYSNLLCRESDPWGSLRKTHTCSMKFLCVLIQSLCTICYMKKKNHEKTCCFCCIQHFMALTIR